ncbi:MAG: GNAT family N-acetyltransferase [Alphaproteobacteria bacterium]|nr:GNAT family N-acetyltransferase [Alphaproteobacteria bacterium]
MFEQKNAPKDRIIVRLAESDAEIESAQKLRYRVFYEEYKAQPTPEITALRKDFDDYDAYADHLVVVDLEGGPHNIVGTYRLLRREKAEEYGHFYSSTEYDLTQLLESGASLLELGRSCVLPEYRAGSVLQLLWQGIANYIMDHKIDLMFGCASLHSTNIEELAGPLSYMYHYHLAPNGLRPRAVEGRFIDMNMIPKEDINPRAMFSELPPLIKGYLRIGALIGDGAVIDPIFNTTDVCIVAQSHMVTKRYRNHYERKSQKSFPNGENLSSEELKGSLALGSAL